MFDLVLKTLSVLPFAAIVGSVRLGMEELHVCTCLVPQQGQLWSVPNDIACVVHHISGSVSLTESLAAEFYSIEVSV